MTGNGRTQPESRDVGFQKAVILCRRNNLAISDPSRTLVDFRSLGYSLLGVFLGGAYELGCHWRNR